MHLLPANLRTRVVRRDFNPGLIGFGDVRCDEVANKITLTELDLPICRTMQPLRGWFLQGHAATWACRDCTVESVCHCLSRDRRASLKMTATYLTERRYAVARASAYSL